MAFKRNTDPASNAGVPCLSIPAGLTLKGKLPVGIEFVCRQNNDLKLLSIG
jgi:Asp-tRNA(Asn)/Glu-tRNA(Gln) amidotransferase A subunit family amidase